MQCIIALYVKPINSLSIPSVGLTGFRDLLLEEFARRRKVYLGYTLRSFARYLVVKLSVVSKFEDSPAVEMKVALFIIFLFVTAVGGQAQANEAANSTVPKSSTKGLKAVAQMVYSSGDKIKIKNLKWVVKPLIVHSEILSKGEISYFVEIDGSYPKPDWTLLDQDRLTGKTKKIRPDPSNGSFRLKIPMAFDIVGADLVAIGPMGEIEKEVVVAYLPGWEDRLKGEAKSNAAPVVSRKTENLMLQLGTEISQVHYSQPDQQLVNETDLGINFESQYWFGQKKMWGLEGALTSTLASLTASPSSRATQFITGDFNLQRAIPLTPALSLNLALGGYFTSSWNGPADFGFSGTVGPELFPILKYEFHDGSAASLALRYSPILSGASLLTLSSRNIVVGVRYFFSPINGGFVNGGRLGINLSFTNSKLETIAGSTSLTSYTLGVMLNL